jgi:hypothetical protein
MEKNGEDVVIIDVDHDDEDIDMLSGKSNKK